MSGRRSITWLGSMARRWPMCGRIGCCGRAKYELRRTKERMLLFVLRPLSFILPRRPRDEPPGGAESAFRFVSAVCAVGVRVCDCGGADEQHRADGVLFDSFARRDVGAV